MNFPFNLFWQLSQKSLGCRLISDKRFWWKYGEHGKPFSNSISLQMWESHLMRENKANALKDLGIWRFFLSQSYLWNVFFLERKRKTATKLPVTPIYNITISLLFNFLSTVWGVSNGYYPSTPSSIRHPIFCSISSSAHSNSDLTFLSIYISTYVVV